MENRPLVSVLIPCYNAENTVEEALLSIKNQTYKNLEIITIDDCSTDKTGEKIKKIADKDPRINYAKNPTNLKISATLNRGIEMCNGKYIARMDSDDIALPERIELQVRYMERNPEIVVSGGTVSICSENMTQLNLRRYNQVDQDIRSKIFRYNPFCHPSTIFRANILREAGGYNPTLFDVEDYDLFFRMGRIGKFGNIPDTLLKYRTSTSSISAVRGRRQEFLTLYTRLKAVAEYGYHASTMDYLYSFAQLFSMLFIPQRIKFWIFNYLRRG